MININDIDNPKFLKEFSNEELYELSDNIRSFLLDIISVNGGHLSSNLGVVDLTIALLKVFDYEKDIITFDVGHQAYTYKILTGRAKEFSKLRKYNGISGFQSINESVYDHYEAGHSSTALSASTGFSIARDLRKETYDVISVIGDGSIGNGIAYEALNHIGDIQNKQIIILNDNEMSISENVGAIHNMLDNIRSGKTYNNAKSNTKSFLNKSSFGKNIASGLDKIKSDLKKIYLKKASIFDDFNIEYYGPINGHDYNELLKYLEIAKNETKSVILHVITQKGKGYKYAEEDKIGAYHGVPSFDLKKGLIKDNSNLPSFSEIISSYVNNYAKKDKDIICITPGMSYGSKLNIIKEKLPNQFIDVGIAEEHSLILANALALHKFKPIVFIYSTFLQRGYDQIVHDIARMDSNVIICVDRAGLVSSDGVSHQGLFDIPMLLSVPNIIISMPKDAKEANDLIYTALNTNHPFVIRYPKINIKYDYNKAINLDIGSWNQEIKGNDATIISYGDFLNKAINISNKLKNDNINIEVVNARFIKPFDIDYFKRIINKNKPIFIYEESMKIGSLGSLLAEEIQKYDTKSKIIILAIEDIYLPTASRDELINITSLDEESIYKKIINYLNKK